MTAPRWYGRACSFEQGSDYLEARFCQESDAYDFLMEQSKDKHNAEIWKDGVRIASSGWAESADWPDWAAKPWTPEAAPMAAGPWVKERDRAPEPWAGSGYDTRSFLVVDGGFGIRTARRAGPKDEQQDGWIVAEMGYVKSVLGWAQIGEMR